MSPFRSVRAHHEERRARVEAEIEAFDGDDVDLVIARTTRARAVRHLRFRLVTLAALGLVAGILSPSVASSLEEPREEGRGIAIGGMRSENTTCARTIIAERADLAACKARVARARVARTERGGDVVERSPD